VALYRKPLRHGTPRHLCGALLWRLLRGKNPAWFRWGLNPPGACEEAVAFFQRQLTERDQP
jgi:hypothetical protein